MKVEKFVVSGGSKRGWTTWTTAAVDPRVVAIVPVVDRPAQRGEVVRASLQGLRLLGARREGLRASRRHGLDRHARSITKLLAIVEPYSYRDRLTMPKFMVNAAGDQFFLPDSSRFYFDDLKGEKYLRYVPNTDHSLRGSDARESMLAFYEAFLRGTPRPKFSWTFEANGDIRVTSKDKPTAVKLWQATNPEHRDFRLETIGPAYHGVRPGGPAAAESTSRTSPAPEKGWTAYFVEMTFPERRQVSVQIHDRGAGQSRHRAVSGVRAEAGREVAVRLRCE